AWIPNTSPTTERRGPGKAFGRRRAYRTAPAGSFQQTLLAFLLRFGVGLAFSQLGQFRSEERRVGRENINQFAIKQFVFFLFFFFQAEDVIRDFHVTGVQTCALPISPGSRTPHRRLSGGALAKHSAGAVLIAPRRPDLSSRHYLLFCCASGLASLSASLVSLDRKSVV